MGWGPSENMDRRKLRSVCLSFNAAISCLFFFYLKSNITVLMDFSFKSHLLYPLPKIPLAEDKRLSFSLLFLASEMSA